MATDNGSNKDELVFTDEMFDESRLGEDGLPKIERRVEHGVWVKRLKPLHDNPGRWAKVYGPCKAPHGTVSTLNRGEAAGVDPSLYEFAGRNIVRTDENGEAIEEQVLDEDGNPTGETEVVKDGFVFARFLTPEQREAKAQAEAEAEAEAETADEQEQGALV